MAATLEKMRLEEKLDLSYKEIRKYQDTLQQAQEQLEGAQGMIEESQVKILRKYFFNTMFRTLKGRINQILNGYMKQNLFKFPLSRTVMETYLHMYQGLTLIKFFRKGNWLSKISTRKQSKCFQAGNKFMR